MDSAARERHRFEDVGFEMPEGWPSRLLVLGRESDSANIVMAWETRRPGEALSEHGFRQILVLAKKKQGERFELLDFHETQIEGRPAVRAHYVSQGTSGLIDQVVLWFDTLDGGVLSIACSAPENVDVALPAFERLVATLVFDPAPEHARASGAPSPPAPRESAVFTFPEVPIPGAVRTRAH
jgi:hypothetical protein